MFICERCIKQYEGPAIDIAKENARLSRGQCTRCDKSAQCFDIPSRANWKLKIKTKKKEQYVPNSN